MPCQVKLFHTAAHSRHSLEDKINAWLSQHGDALKIIRVLQSSGGNVESVSITIFYRLVKT